MFDNSTHFFVSVNYIPLPPLKINTNDSLSKKSTLSAPLAVVVGDLWRPSSPSAAQSPGCAAVWDSYPLCPSPTASRSSPPLTDGLGTPLRLARNRSSAPALQVEVGAQPLPSPVPRVRFSPPVLNPNPYNAIKFPAAGNTYHVVVGAAGSERVRLEQPPPDELLLRFPASGGASASRAVALNPAGILLSRRENAVPAGPVGAYKASKRCPWPWKGRPCWSPWTARGRSSVPAYQAPPPPATFLCQTPALRSGESLPLYVGVPDPLP